MNVFFIGAGFLFLLNPVLGLFDLLPDFIGYTLIILGIRDASYIVEELSLARRRYTYLIWVGIARLLLSLSGVNKINTLPLTLAFSIAVVEGILLVLATKSLFGGIEYAAMRYGGSGILSSGMREGFYHDEGGEYRFGKVPRDSVGGVRVFAIVLFVVRETLSVVPELPALQLTDHAGDIAALDFSSVSTLIRFAVSVVFLIPAVVFFVILVRFLRRVAAAEDLLSGIDREINERYGGPYEPRMCSRMRAVSFFAGAAVLLYMGFYDYQINMIPRYIPAAIVIFVSLAMFVSANRAPSALVPVIPSVFAIPVSIYTSKLQNDYYALYKAIMLQTYLTNDEYVYDQHINQVKPGYWRLAAVELAEALLCGAAIILMLVVYYRLSASHAESFRSVSEHDRADIARSQKRRFVLLMIFGAISVIAYSAYRFVLPYFASMPMTCIALNLVFFGFYLNYSLMNNQYVYTNLQ